jgi:hypothetical protein
MTMETLHARIAHAAGDGPVLLVGPELGCGPPEPGGAWHRLCAREVLDGQSRAHPRYALAVIVGTLEHLPRARGAELIATLRDLWVPRLLVALPAEAPPEWQLEDMLAHGLEAQGEALGPEGPVTLYGFDIDRYKRTPDWLNPRNWAHPERWGRHRW